MSWHDQTGTLYVDRDATCPLVLSLQPYCVLPICARLSRDSTATAGSIKARLACSERLKVGRLKQLKSTQALSQLRLSVPRALFCSRLKCRGKNCKLVRSKLKVVELGKWNNQAHLAAQRRCTPHPPHDTHERRCGAALGCLPGELGRRVGVRMATPG